MEILNKISLNYSNKTKILIYLDSIDQLVRQDYNLDWLISTVPNNNVKIVYSVLSDYEGIFERIGEVVSNYFKINELTLDEAKANASDFT